MPDSSASIVLFDGVCNLCNGFVQFIISHDPAGRFRFTALQSEAGQALLARYGQLPAATPETVMLLENGQLYTHSTAALRIAKGLNWPWRGVAAALVLPRFLRDAAYRFVARNRYRWFGRQESCWLPTPELKARFL
ncbi:thiol-disulfide oxidoreductase DCC family protein [Hymenobacter psychrotolerans]|uniref:Predicted thiol-disulfide oxidoreductase YuxK, DCC family n=1 Tax=Hymenobacter psychrotolerans DSM 18569 TaxID=1121959 RepID=A0A1M6WWE1_9BACT|nr:thiol-disulfide oxidoreductase DCC family protein [Hymenobacter psychrotolerans]SHK98102.1 Predicted thiol-disulfide oxidoreductase YuxK, DCC family [Hymenobacter psychrotolerans DSM 18569]